MSERQQFVDKIRALVSELREELKNKKFIKEVEPFVIKEAIVMLEKAESYLNGYLQEDKYRGN